MHTRPAIKPVERVCSPAISRGARIPPGPADGCNTPQELLHWTNRQFERYGDIFKAPVHGASAYFVSSPEYAQRILRTNWQNYKLGQEFKRVALLLGGGLVVSEGEMWKRQRLLVQPAFREDAIGAVAKPILAVNAALLKKWKYAAQRKDQINVTRDTSLMVLEVTLSAIFGPDYDRVAQHFKILSDESTRDLQFVKKLRALSGPLLEVIDDRRRASVEPRDILGMLMQARDRETGQPMSEAQLANEILTLVVAGHETTASVLNWVWLLLSQNPEVEEKLFRELLSINSGSFPGVQDLPKFTYTRHVIEEALRLYPPVWLISRRAVGDDWLGEYFVPAGTQIYISSYFIQRHPRLWTEPERFNPERFSRDARECQRSLNMLAFSAGPRNCVGEFLSRLEMQIHLMTVAKELQLFSTGTTTAEFDVGVNLRPKYDQIISARLREFADAYPPAMSGF